MPEDAITYSTPAEALRAAVDTVGSQAAMARLLGIAQPSVFNWLKRAKPLPAEHVITVEEATGISRHDLRPDVYPRAGAGSSPPIAEEDATLFDRFGGVRAMADDLELPVSTVIRWQQERRIAAEHQHAVLRAGLRRQLAITAEDVMFPFPADRLLG